MAWPSIREFLRIPQEFTGNDVSIAIVDGRFPNHPDIATNEHRKTYVINLSEAIPQPSLMTADDGPWNKGLHGLWTAAAAAGSGHLSKMHYAGAAPDANLYLVETGRLNTVHEIENTYVAALNWLIQNWRCYHIRGVVLTIASTRDTGLLPWQADPIRVKCEQLVQEGLLVVVASGNTMELTCSGPASSPSVLSVGGVIIPENGAIKDTEPYHGCRGQTFEGKWIPEILAPAENVVLPMPFQSREERNKHFTASKDNLPEDYARTEGTSFAGPIILGCAACIWQVHPDWSADQVKSAILGSSINNEMWLSLNAGLIDVTAAIRMEPPKDSHIKPYSIWSEWKSKDDSTHLDAMNDPDEGVVVAALLSLQDDPLPDVIEAQMIRLLEHQSKKIRTAAIIAFSFHPDKNPYRDLLQLLHDDSSYVRMAALFALNHRPEVWHEMPYEMIRLFQNSDLNLQYCSVTLASIIKNQIFIEPLISGLYNDAENDRVSIFGARCDALEAITGVAFDPIPEWQEGQCFYSDQSRQARLHIAQMWNQSNCRVESGKIKGD
ncbi:S8 family serine peptidase [Paenibacillus lautus]|uniref:S8 family serine peptidase n=1 Tax=Paenibacillus lautus TaxID=1401 RepID=UPI00384ACFF1